jgi:hypothetical protein
MEQNCPGMEFVWLKTLSLNSHIIAADSYQAPPELKCTDIILQHPVAHHLLAKVTGSTVLRAAHREEGKTSKHA